MRNKTYVLDKTEFTVHPFSLTSTEHFDTEIYELQM